MRIQVEFMALDEISANIDHQADCDLFHQLAEAE